MLGVYLDVNLTSERKEKEGIEKLLLKKKSTRGRKPTPHTKELGGPRKRIGKVEENEEDEDIDTVHYRALTLEIMAITRGLL